MSRETDELEELRNEIDRLDDEIIEAVVERLQVAEQIAQVKTESGNDLVDKDREEIVKSNYADLFEKNGMNAKNGRELAEWLIETSLSRESQVKE